MLKKFDWDQGFFRLWLVYGFVVFLFTALWVLGHPEIGFLGEKAPATFDPNFVYEAKPRGFLDRFALFLALVSIYLFPPPVMYLTSKWILLGFKKS